MSCSQLSGSLELVYFSFPPKSMCAGLPHQHSSRYPGFCPSFLDFLRFLGICLGTGPKCIAQTSAPPIGCSVGEVLDPEELKSSPASHGRSGWWVPDCKQREVST